MKKNEIKKEETKAEVLEVHSEAEPSELDQLRVLHKEMKDRGFNSIGDIEVRISRL